MSLPCSVTLAPCSRRCSRRLKSAAVHRPSPEGRVNRVTEALPTDAVPAQPLGEPAVEPVAQPEVAAVASELEQPVEPAPADDDVLVGSNGHAPATPASLGFFA